MTKQRRFTREFEDEAVRLARTSGRTQREVADDLGIGLSTLVRWIGRSRDRVMEAPDRADGQEDDVPAPSAGVIRGVAGMFFVVASGTFFLVHASFLMKVRKCFSLDRA